MFQCQIRRTYDGRAGGRLVRVWKVVMERVWWTGVYEVLLLSAARVGNLKLGPMRIREKPSRLMAPVEKMCRQAGSGVEFLEDSAQAKSSTTVARGAAHC